MNKLKVGDKVKLNLNHIRIRDDFLKRDVIEFYNEEGEGNPIFLHKDSIFEIIKHDGKSNMDIKDMDHGMIYSNFFEGYFILYENVYDPKYKNFLEKLKNV